MWNDIAVVRRDSHVAMLEGVVDAILTDGAVPAGADDAAASLGAVKAIYRSRVERRTIDIA